MIKILKILAVLVSYKKGIHSLGEIEFDLNRVTFTTAQKQDY